MACALENSNLSGGKTGWPAGMLQDDSRELSRWLASRPGARRLVKEQNQERSVIRRKFIGSGEDVDLSQLEQYDYPQAT